MSQPAPPRSHEVDDLQWNYWTKSFGMTGRIRPDSVDDFIGIRNLGDYYVRSAFPSIKLCFYGHSGGTVVLGAHGQSLRPESLRSCQEGRDHECAIVRDHGPLG